MSDRGVVIRSMRPRDVAAAVTLLGQLGYSLEPFEVRRRFAAVSAVLGHGVFIAEADAKPVTLLHILERRALAERRSARRGVRHR